MNTKILIGAVIVVALLSGVIWSGAEFETAVQTGHAEVVE